MPGERSGRKVDGHHEKFMKEALRLARRGLGRTSPNPAVGAVVVRDGKVIASGYHKYAGGDHAEVEALSKLGGKARRSDTMYVTLEPCHHHGKTPPCTEAILKSGLGKVVVGARDPNPAVKGGGSEFLAAKGVEVVTGILEEECRRLNESFFKFVTSGTPFVSAKCALTLDGWIATSTGHSRWITNEKSRRFVHRLRDGVDAVMVGVGTVIADDPMLTVRLGNRNAQDPVRVILDTNLRISPDAKVLNIDSPSSTLIVVGEGVPENHLRAIQKDNVSTLICPKRGGRIDLNTLMGLLGQRSISSVLLEGGATLMGAMLREKLLDKFYIFKGARILGGDDGIPMARGRGAESMDQSIRIKDVSVRRFGDDVLIVGYPEYFNPTRRRPRL
ncbi:MAG: bifunctional diaminohydroxyphosphoribosylaminopyrimidine deaminase/5-amino-6-(5-phosphoribosylamino)uracil reductase RibD [Deltaproteobacteria bacterium]|nr:bifunctional diaminohydroxyphosphoribosylaminopyrimidine deaminase/5-amino-6-(5-phosphoribosylamino)uracil reductase RibD [Deltaproteobacteria bacterium]MBW1920982.1 bifunctional diaminohydroxyphosphoribosylaminopyrimidine deaminase/5-amino-6-(5-phosphoribosylamino)uracil reductase RibD [Deltaproteobacteria bacterium]MBW1978801.1 bifunctional diaminohydroxyphosphoribosylaminopyrimidine deaminase/5-amino-6-(5-phosphoribosylamino)uracil reductase RibD [Deltaproteobacteria bacterium]MBW2045110.1